MRDHQRNIKVSIGRLILDGVSVPRHQRPVLQAAFEAELMHLLTANGLAPSLQAGGTALDVSGGEIQLTGDGDGTQMGQQIARAVYGSISAPASKGSEG